MANELTKQEVKKHVAAIHTSASLTLLQRKLVNVLLLNAYDNLLKQDEHTIPLGILAILLGWNESRNIKDIKDALQSLQTTAIAYDLLEDGKTDGWESTQILGTVRIRDGRCSYFYPHGLPEKLANPSVYATINISIQNRFSSTYSLSLYENCLRFKKVGSTGWHSVGLWRSMLGALDPHYEEFKRFNSKIIAKAVSEINTVSDIEIEPEFKKVSRRVTEIRFKVEEKRQKSIFPGEETDANEELRNSEIYKRLTEHGIGDKLAISMIREETPERLDAVVKYTEEQDKSGRIQNPAGYILKLLNTDAALGETVYKKQKRAFAEQAKAVEEVEARQVAEAEMAALDREKRVKARMKNMSTEEHQECVARFLATREGAACRQYLDKETGTFKKGIGRVQFHAWLIPQIAASLDP